MALLLNRLSTTNLQGVIQNLNTCDVRLEGMCCYFPQYCDPIAKCVSSTPNSLVDLPNTFPRCACPDGYEGDGRAKGSGCRNVNECETGQAKCQHRCVDLIPGYRCECHEGYQLDSDGRSCRDVNECTEKLHQCSHICHNTKGSYECRCPPGFLLNQDLHSCSDIDECLESQLTGRRICPYDQLCINTPGSYECGCPVGLLPVKRSSASDYTRSDYTRSDLPRPLDYPDYVVCEDVDECLLQGANACPNAKSIVDGRLSQVCENVYAGHVCRCLPGLRPVYLPPATAAARRLSSDSATSSNSQDCSEPREILKVTAPTQSRPPESNRIATKSLRETIKDCDLEYEIEAKILSRDAHNPVQEEHEKSEPNGVAHQEAEAPSKRSPDVAAPHESRTHSGEQDFLDEVFYFRSGLSGHVADSDVIETDYSYDDSLLSSDGDDTIIMAYNDDDAESQESDWMYEPRPSDIIHSEDADDPEVHLASPRGTSGVIYHDSNYRGGYSEESGGYRAPREARHPFGIYDGLIADGAFTYGNKTFAEEQAPGGFVPTAVIGPSSLNADGGFESNGFENAENTALTEAKVSLTSTNPSTPPNSRRHAAAGVVGGQIRAMDDGGARRLGAVYNDIGSGPEAQKMDGQGPSRGEGVSVGQGMPREFWRQEVASPEALAVEVEGEIAELLKDDEVKQSRMSIDEIKTRYQWTKAQRERVVCVDVDECVEDSNACPSDAACFNTYKAYECHCKDPSKVFDWEQKKCMRKETRLCDVQECHGPCMRSAANGYHCGCPRGYVDKHPEHWERLSKNALKLLDSSRMGGEPSEEDFQEAVRAIGGSCVDVDECSLPGVHVCGVGCQCVNTVGGFNCSCPEQKVAQQEPLAKDFQFLKALTEQFAAHLDIREDSQVLRSLKRNGLLPVISAWVSSPPSPELLWAVDQIDWTRTRYLKIDADDKLPGNQSAWNKLGREDASQVVKAFIEYTLVTLKQSYINLCLKSCASCSKDKPCCAHNRIDCVQGGATRSSLFRPKKLECPSGTMQVIF